VGSFAKFEAFHTLTSFALSLTYWQLERILAKMLSWVVVGLVGFDAAI
jgi:hypothetical protein